MSVTADQRQDALEVANEIRARLAGFKRHIASLEKHQAWHEVASTLLDRPELIGEMEVHMLLLALPGFGPVRMRRVCQRLPVWPFTTVGVLTLNQRQRLASMIRRPVG